MFGDWLRERRRSRGLTQLALANAIDVSRQTVNNWETGKTLPVLTRNRLQYKLCFVLQVSAEELITSLIGELVGNEQQD